MHSECKDCVPLRRPRQVVELSETFPAEAPGPCGSGAISHKLIAISRAGLPRGRGITQAAPALAGAPDAGAGACSLLPGGRGRA